MKNWKTMIDSAMNENGESWEDVVANTMTDEEMDKAMDKDFASGYFLIQGCTFTVWTNKSVYFPACDGIVEWVERISRNPDGKPTKHIGG